MAEDLSEELGQNIPLSEMLESLRLELGVALAAGDGKRVRFEIERVNLELSIVVKKTKKVGMKAVIGVLSLDGSGGKDVDAVHKFSLSIIPKDFLAGAPSVLTAGGEETAKDAADREAMLGGSPKPR